jgi:hypothetical protein
VTTQPTQSSTSTDSGGDANNTGGQSSNSQNNLFDQWMRMQSQLMTQATSMLSAVV